MAQTKRKRRTKHRGNAAGMVETRGRTGRKPGPAERKAAARQARMDRFSKPPTCAARCSARAIAAIVFVAAMILIVQQPVAASIALGGFVLLLYIPLGYYTDLFLYRRRQAKELRAGEALAVDVRMFTVGPFQENCYLVRARRRRPRRCSSTPATRPSACWRRSSELGVEPEAILLTHTHFDHIGAVAPVARATGAPVVLPARSRSTSSRHHDRFFPPASGRVERWDAESRRGRRAPAARGLRHRRRLHARPQPRPRHLRDRRRRSFSGDVLFQNSVGRTDLPGGDHADAHGLDRRRCSSASTTTRTVHPGHMGLTTLGRERATNPFLQALAGR